MIRLATLFYLGMFVIALILSTFTGQASDWFVWVSETSVSQPEWFPSSRGAWATSLRVLQDTGIGISVGLVIVAFTQWLSPRLKWGQQLTQDFARVFGKLSWSHAFFLAFLSGVAEEALFRVAMQSMVTRWTTPVWGIIIVGLLFGVIHSGPQKHYLVWTIFAIVFGFLAGWLYFLRGGLVLVAVLHMTVNTFNLKWIADKGQTDAFRPVQLPMRSLPHDEESEGT